MAAVQATYATFAADEQSRNACGDMRLFVHESTAAAMFGAGLHSPRRVRSHGLAAAPAASESVIRSLQSTLARARASGDAVRHR